MIYENDYELISKLHEGYEEANDILYSKYLYIVETEVKKHLKTSYALRYDYNDLYQEALVAFSLALANYREESKSTLSSFLTLCVDRKIRKALQKASRGKNKMVKEALSLDETYGESNVPLIDFISDDSDEDPLQSLIRNEYSTRLENNVKKLLSASEYEVYKLHQNGHKNSDISLILKKDAKQIDNTMQRIRSKIKKYVEI